MSFVENLPTTFQVGIWTFSCQRLAEENVIQDCELYNRETLLLQIAERVSSIYTSFLTVEGRANLDLQQVRVQPNFPARLPAAEKVQVFKEHLQNLILNKLEDEKEHSFGYCKLKVYSEPKELLSIALTRAGFNGDDYRYRYYFPLDSFTTIKDDHFDGSITLNIKPLSNYF